MSRLPGLTRMLLALLILAMTAVPAFDAWACALDTDTPVLRVAAEEGDHATGSSNAVSHGLCPHGHCHHVATHLPAEAAATATVRARPLRPPPEDDAFVSHSPEGPSRPPQA